MALQQRQPVFTRRLFIPEVTPGSDTGITTAYVMWQAGKPGFMHNQPVLVVPNYTGDRQTVGKVWGMRRAEGADSLNFDFLFNARIDKVFFGSGNYSRPGGGATTLHRMSYSAGSLNGPGTSQLEDQFLEATAKYVRNRFIMVDSLGFKSDYQGGVKRSISFKGIGEQPQLTSITSAPTSATVTDDSLSQNPTDCFNGLFFVNALAAVPEDFSINLGNGISVTPVGYNNGAGGSVIFDKLAGPGSLKLMMVLGGTNPESELTFYNWANARTVIPLEVWHFDKPTGGAWTKYSRYRYAVVFEEKPPTSAGGEKDLYTEQNFEPWPNYSWSGDIVAPAPGPYTLPATPNLGVKVDGGSTITVALTAGSQTAAQIATALNASGPFTAVAVADSPAGTLRITSKTTGTTSSIQIDGAVANTAHTAIGFNTVAQAGFTNCSVIHDYLNGVGSNL